MAVPPVRNPHYVRFVKEQITSQTAMSAWDVCLPRCVKAPHPVSLSIMELALYFHTKCLGEVGPLPSSGVHLISFLFSCQAMTLTVIQLSVH